jgi:predicted amidohydrolase YtcJ
MNFGPTGMGTLQPGQPADLVVLDGDPFALDGATCVATMVEGRFVWQHPEEADSVPPKPSRLR